MTDEPVLVHDETTVDGSLVRVLTLNRPGHRNPLDHATVLALMDRIGAAEADPDVRSLIVTGAGPAFSSGGDLRAYLALYENPPRFQAFLDDFHRMCDALERGRLVTCAMVNGACVAGGLELALACDFITMADDAVIGDGHAASGQLPGGGGSQRLFRAVGPQVAKDLLLTGRLLEAAEAAQVNLVRRVFAPDQLLAETLTLLTRVGAHSPLVIRRMKQLISVAENAPLDEGLATERTVVHRYATTSFDAKEGLHAFLERRRANYRGE